MGGVEPTPARAAIKLGHMQPNPSAQPKTCGQSALVARWCADVAWKARRAGTNQEGLALWVETQATEKKKGAERPSLCENFSSFSLQSFTSVSFTQRKYQTIMLNIVITFLRALIPLLQTFLANLEQEQRQDLENLFAPGHRLRSERQSTGLDAQQRRSASPESTVDEPVRTPSRSTARPEPSTPTSPTVRGRQTSSSPPWRHLDLRCGGYSHTRPTTTVTRCAWCGREPSDRSPVPDNEWQKPHRFMRQVGSTWQVLIPAPVPGA